MNDQCVRVSDIFARAGAVSMVRQSNERSVYARGSGRCRTHFQPGVQCKSERSVYARSRRGRQTHRPVQGKSERSVYAREWDKGSPAKERWRGAKVNDQCMRGVPVKPQAILTSGRGGKVNDWCMRGRCIDGCTRARRKWRGGKVNDWCMRGMILDLLLHCPRQYVNEWQSNERSVYARTRAAAAASFGSNGPALLTRY